MKMNKALIILVLTLTLFPRLRWVEAGVNFSLDTRENDNLKLISIQLSGMLLAKELLEIPEVNYLIKYYNRYVEMEINLKRYKKDSFKVLDTINTDDEHLTTRLGYLRNLIDGLKDNAMMTGWEDVDPEDNEKEYILIGGKEINPRTFHGIEKVTNPEDVKAASEDERRYLADRIRHLVSTLKSRGSPRWEAVRAIYVATGFHDPKRGRKRGGYNMASYQAARSVSRKALSEGTDDRRKHILIIAEFTKILKRHGVITQMTRAEEREYAAIDKAMTSEVKDHKQRLLEIIQREYMEIGDLQYNAYSMPDHTIQFNKILERFLAYADLLSGADDEDRLIKVLFYEKITQAMIKTVDRMTVIFSDDIDSFKVDNEIELANKLKVLQLKLKQELLAIRISREDNAMVGSMFYAGSIPVRE